MICEVMLHGHSNLWSFHGSAGISSWLARLPWVSQGGVAAVASGYRREPTFLLEGIARAAYWANSGCSNLRVRGVSIVSDVQPMNAIFSELGISEELNQFEQRRLLALDLRDHTYLFVLTASRAFALEEWDDLLDAVEYCSKSGFPASLAIVVISGHGTLTVPPGIPAFDMNAGRPTVPVMAYVESEAPLLWQAYVHHRIAWEIAGDVETAVEVDQMLTSLRVGDDQGLELFFNNCADRFALKFPDEIARLGNYLRARKALPSVRVKSDLAAMELQLLSDRVLWFPPGASSPKISPTVCRALARGGVEQNAVWGMRDSLVCAPLANEIFEVCIHAEHVIRARLLSGPLVGQPPEKATTSFERFKRGEDRAVSYPYGHPLPPTTDRDMWAFASLGEILYVAPASQPQVYWSVLHLRNAVAHGHYVCWKHVTSAAEIVRSMRS